MFWFIPTRVFQDFFIIVTVIIDATLKNYFVILCFKSQAYCGVKKTIVACRPILLHTQKSFVGQVWKSVTIMSTYLFLNFLSRKLRNVILLFNQINLNSSFSMGY